MKRRIRVLQMVDNIFVLVAGAERFMMGLATHLPRDRFEVQTLTTRSVDLSALKVLRDAGLRHTNLGRCHKYDIYRLAGLARLLRRERIDVLHAHGFGSNLWASLIGTACFVPAIVAQEHTWSYEGQRLRKFLDGKIIAKLSDRFVAVSYADQERMIRLEGVPPEKTLVIPAAYVPRVAGRNNDLRSELGLPPGTPMIGTASVMRPQKAHEVLLEAYRCLLERVPDAHLVLAGDGPTRLDLERRTSDIGLTDRVSFLGVRDDVDAILRSIDVAVLSSDFEGTPLMAFECMATSTPLVATNVGGLSEVVEDGVTGILVPPRNPRALADAIADLLGDSQRRAALGAAANDRLGRYTIESAAGRFAQLYEELLEGKSR